MAQPQPQAGERIQYVYFLRHGVAQHNLRDPVTGQSPNIRSPALLDPPLVEAGQQQALAVGKRLSHLLPQIQLIVASPLTRCLQTAQLVFSKSSTSSGAPAPLACLEQVREAYGMHYPDKRRDKSILQKQFPTIHFDPNMTERDEQWSDSWRESPDDVVQRVEVFFQWILQRQESHIFVVSHGVWIECLLNAYFPLMLQGGARVYNCDCFVAEVVSQNGSFVRLQNVGKI